MIGLVLMAGRSPAQSIYTPYTVTNFAGSAGNIGSTNGTGSAARFNSPYAVAADSAGNVYVADTLNDTIRKITPAGAVTTLAGKAGSAGSANGTGSAARFYKPSGVAVDGAGNVYVADTLNDTIRKITPAGAVTTLAGKAGVSGTNNGTGSSARFNTPFGVAVDKAGNVYVADTYNQTIRKVTSAGVVTTLVGAGALAFQPFRRGGGQRGQCLCGGLRQPYHPKGDAGRSGRRPWPARPGSSGSADGTGTAARFYFPVQCGGGQRHQCLCG